MPIEKPLGKFTIWPLAFFAADVCIFEVWCVPATPAGAAWQGKLSVHKDDSDSAAEIIVCEGLALLASFCQFSCKTTAQPSEAPQLFLLFSWRRQIVFARDESVCR